MTLPTLITAVRRDPRERPLICPTCAGPIHLESGLYWCRVCRGSYARLAELAALKGESR